MINEWVEIIKKLQYLRAVCGQRGRREKRDVKWGRDQREDRRRVVGPVRREM
jgi:hypothetical protein